MVCHMTYLFIHILGDPRCSHHFSNMFQNLTSISASYVLMTDHLNQEEITSYLCSASNYLIGDMTYFGYGIMNNILVF